MQAYWMRIERHLAKLGCLNPMALRPGAADADVIALEQHLGVPLPDAVKQFLAIHDGQDGFGLIFGQQLLSVAEIREQWDVWRDMDEAQMNAECADYMASDPAGVIKPLYSNRAWIPLTHDAGGNHIGIDFDPDQFGAIGQIITFGRDEDTKRLIGATFEAFLVSYVAWLERATWTGAYLDAPRPF